MQPNTVPSEILAKPRPRGPVIYLAAPGAHDPRRRPPALARLLRLDVWGTSLLTIRAQHEMGAAAVMLVIVFVFELIAWTLLFDVIVHAARSEGVARRLLALGFGLLFASAVFLFERGFMTTDLSASPIRKWFGLGLRAVVIGLSALATAQPVELLLFGTEIDERVRDEAVRTEALHQWHAAKPERVAPTESSISRATQSLATSPEHDELLRTQRDLENAARERDEASRGQANAYGEEQVVRQRIEEAQRRLEQTQSQAERDGLEQQIARDRANLDRFRQESGMRQQNRAKAEQLLQHAQEKYESAKRDHDRAERGWEAAVAAKAKEIEASDTATSGRVREREEWIHTLRQLPLGATHPGIAGISAAWDSVPGGRLREATHGARRAPSRQAPKLAAGRCGRTPAGGCRIRDDRHGRRRPADDRAGPPAHGGAAPTLSCGFSRSLGDPPAHDRVQGDRGAGARRLLLDRRPGQRRQPGRRRGRPDPGALVNPPRRLARLEYGKLCVHRGGRIEGRAESRVLARTPDFPAALEPLCAPSRLGAGRELSAGFPHTTALWPVYTAGRSGVVAYRLRLRPEDGDGGTGRRYWVGRYLTPTAGSLDPWAAHQALAGDLTGLAREDLDLTAADLEPPARPPLVLGDRRFLLPAIIHVMSGVPIGVRAPLDEATFFRLAAGLWWLVPPALRAFVSIVFGASEAISAGATMACAHQFPAVTAVFEAADGAWAPSASGDARNLAAGRAYVARAFPRDATGRPLLGELNPILDEALCAPPTRVPADDGAVPFAGRVARAFRAVGERCREESRYEKLVGWLNGAGADDDSIWAAASDYADPEHRRRVLDRALEALSSPERRGRADCVLWSSARADPVLAGQLALHPSARARWLGVLAQGDGRVLEELERASRAGVSDALPAEATMALVDQLDADAKAPGAANRHAALLASSAVPGAYGAWARARGEALTLLVLDAEEPARNAALSALALLCGFEAPLALGRWRVLGAPEPGDAARLAALTPMVRRSLDADLERRWRGRGSDAAKATRVLSWILLRPDLLADDVVVRIARGDDAVLSGSVDAVLAALRGRAAPPGVLDTIAAGVLRHLDLYRPALNEDRALFRDVLVRFPAAVRWVLLDRSGASPPPLDPGADVPAEVEAAARAMMPSGREIDAALDRAWRRNRRLDLRGVAPLVWRWIEDGRAAGPATGGVADVCRGLLQGRLPERFAGDHVTEIAALLVRDACVVDDLRPHRDALWAHAARASPASPQRARLVLELFAADDLIPTPPHVAALTPAPAWLCKHVAGPGVHPLRADRFAVCLAGFQGLDFAASGHAAWRDEWSQSHVWAVFRHLPTRLQGDLNAALAAFGGDTAHREARIALATRWCTDSPEQGQTEARHDACRRIAVEVILPAWLKGGADADELRWFCALVRAGRDCVDVPAGRGRERRLQLVGHRPDRPVVADQRTVQVDASFHRLIATVAPALDAAWPEPSTSGLSVSAGRA
ncbi:MAG: DUF4407 domain-containing protein [Minicystis sp.]